MVLYDYTINKKQCLHQRHVEDEDGVKAYFSTHNTTCFGTSNLSEILTQGREKILKSLDAFVSRGTLITYE